MVRIIAGLVTGSGNMMNRKKFFTLVTTSFVGIAFLKFSPFKFFNSNKNSLNGNTIKVKKNPLAVNREKTGRKNG
jgi:hypothetical protein